MGEFFSWLKAIDSVKAGTLFGVVLGCILYLSVREAYVAAELIVVAALSGATGTVVQRLLRYLLRRKLEQREFERDLNELEDLRKNGKINKRTHQQIVNDFVRKKFLHKK